MEVVSCSDEPYGGPIDTDTIGLQQSWADGLGEGIEIGLKLAEFLFQGMNP